MLNYSAKRIAAAILGASLICLSAGCSSDKSNEANKELQQYSGQEFVMDTAVSINVYADTEQHANQAIKAGFDEFRRIDKLSDRFTDKSETDVKSDIALINEAAGKAPVHVSKDICNMVAQSLKFNKEVTRSFDITVAPLMDMWGFGDKKFRVPSAQELSRGLGYLGMQDIQIDEKEQTVFLKRAGMKLDLGGIAKGYATDKATEKLKTLGIEHAVINAGGNVYAIGSKPDGSPWRIGIRDPRDEKGIIGVLSIKDEAVVSSGDYERFFIVGDKRYHHILDPKTGKPGDRSMATTIVCKSSTQADLLSTGVFLLGPQEGIAVCKKLNSAEAIVIAPNKEISFTAGIKKAFEFTAQEKGYVLRD